MFSLNVYEKDICLCGMCYQYIKSLTSLKRAGIVLIGAFREVRDVRKGMFTEG